VKHSSTKIAQLRIKLYLQEAEKAISMPGILNIFVRLPGLVIFSDL
jgi:hypothetical protein